MAREFTQEEKNEIEKSVDAERQAWALQVKILRYVDYLGLDYGLHISDSYSPTLRDLQRNSLPGWMYEITELEKILKARVEKQMKGDAYPSEEELQQIRVAAANLSLLKRDIIKIGRLYDEGEHNDIKVRKLFEKYKKDATRIFKEITSRLFVFPYKTYFQKEADAIHEKILLHLDNLSYLSFSNSSTETLLAVLQTYDDMIENLVQRAMKETLAKQRAEEELL